MNLNQRTIILYNTAECNLHCKYCFISKNKSMKNVDDALLKCFQNNYIPNMITKYIKDLSTVKNVEIWGGEPLLHTERIIDTIKWLIENCPNFQNITFSSNYTHNKVVPSFKILMELLSKYPDRQFEVGSQISLDGPEDITDLNRGKGTTKKVLENFNILANNKYFAPENVKVYAHCKATLDKECIRKLLDKDYIIKYYKFFEDNIYDVIEANKNKNFRHKNYTIANIATPGEYTKEDGLILAQVCKLCREIEKENREKHYFKYYKNITVFDRHNEDFLKERNIELTLNNGFFGQWCGIIQGVLGILPDGKICTCHRSFEDFFQDYVENFNDGFKNSTLNYQAITNSGVKSKDHYIFNDDKDIQVHLEKMNLLFNRTNYNTSVPVKSIYLIRNLAKLGQINKKYEDYHEAVKGFYKVRSIIGSCAYCNSAVTGTTLLESTSEIKLILNGAENFICEENL